MKIAEKIKNAMENMLPSDEAELYYKDETLLKQWDQNLRYALEHANTLLGRYQTASGYKISTAEDLLTLSKNPTEFFKEQHMKVHSKKFEEFLALKMEFTISPPSEGWNDVKSACKGFAKFSANYAALGYFQITNNEVRASEKYYLKRNAKCFHYATTKAEKERLKFALSVIESVKQLEPVLEKNPKLYNKALSEKLYFFPLPYFLRRVQTPSGFQIIPNPLFVLFEFQKTDHLGIHIPSDADLNLLQKDAINRIGERYIHFYRRMKAGEPKLYKVLEDNFDQHFDPATDTKVRGVFNRLGDEWGIPMDAAKSRAVKETTWAPH